MFYLKNQQQQRNNVLKVSIKYRRGSNDTHRILTIIIITDFRPMLYKIYCKVILSNVFFWL